MIESIFITIFPFLFLILLFFGEKLFHNKNFDAGGKPPINKIIFLSSKYSIIVLWIIVIIKSWGWNISMLQIPASIKYLSLILWVLGFSLLFVGRFGMGSSFRIGQPKENISLTTTGLFKISRNPMYLGVYATILASIVYTANVFVLLIGVFVIIVHHKIVLSEEKYLQQKFTKKYDDYCIKVRRYI
jgi:protein-S-isoprenylcysteine O-methyltransferase Ste14